MRASRLVQGAVLVALVGILAIVAVAGAEPEPSATAIACPSVKDRACVEPADRFPATTRELCCLSVVRGITGKVVHVWLQGDKERWRYALAVQASGWTTWSQMTLPPGASGPWRVEVRDEAGTVLGQASFAID